MQSVHGAVTVKDDVAHKGQRTKGSYISVIE